jgi:hypothetical protein
MRRYLRAPLNDEEAEVVCDQRASAAATRSVGKKTFVVTGIAIISRTRKPAKK